MDNFVDNSEISLGLVKNSTGSCSIKCGNKAVFVTVNGPEESDMRDDTYDAYESEDIDLSIKCKLCPNISSSSKIFENLCIELINKILKKYLIKDQNLLFKTISVSIYSNTENLSMICNAVLISLIHAGIPIFDMFYCVGTLPFFVFSNDQIDLCHHNGAIIQDQINDAKIELKRVKMAIRTALEKQMLFSKES